MTSTGIEPNSAAKAFTNEEQKSDYLDYLQQRKEQLEPAEFISADEKMHGIRNIIDQIKNTTVSVLVSGESGTGKEVLARALHEASDRKNKPFVAVNCAALPTNLLESELFGYERGAFTGAHAQHKGKFEQANGGTLLLDEVTEMDPALQAKLLRALQEKEIERIGGSGPISVDTRIVATTNRDITKAVAEGQFRQDLYYRLDVIHLEIPSLRERPKDIDCLADHFLERYATQFSKGQLQFSAEARNKLRGHRWPGNVRELQNIVQRSVLLARDNIISAAEVPIEGGSRNLCDEWIRQLPLGKTLRDVETQFILQTLKHHNGNRTHAAKTLGISLRTLRNKINEFRAEGLEVMSPGGR